MGSHFLTGVKIGIFPPLCVLILADILFPCRRRQWVPLLSSWSLQVGGWLFACVYPSSGHFMILSYPLPSGFLFSIIHPTCPSPFPTTAFFHVFILCLCICACVCACACACVCMHECVCAFMCMHACVCILYAHMRACVDIHMCVCSCACMCVCVCVSENSILTGVILPR